MEACKVGNSEVVHLLLEHGADINLANDVNDYGCPGCNVLTPCIQENWNALMEAVEYGNIDVVDILLTRGAHPNMQDNVSQIAFSCSFMIFI